MNRKARKMNKQLAQGKETTGNWWNCAVIVGGALAAVVSLSVGAARFLS